MSTKHRTLRRRQLFPEKLWDLVNKPASGIKWSSDGKRIQVDRSKLEKSICTKFRSRKFDSFIRQLHFYGFRKCGNSYYHDKFQRGHPETLVTMRRKYSKLTSSSDTEDSSPPSPGSEHSSPNPQSGDSSPRAQSGDNSPRPPCYTRNISYTSSDDSSSSYATVSNITNLKKSSFSWPEQDFPIDLSRKAQQL